MSVLEEPAANAPSQASAATPAGTNLRAEEAQPQTAAAGTGHSPDNTVGNNGPGADSGVPGTQSAGAAAHSAPATSTIATNPFEDDADADDATPALPPRPAEELTMATSSAAPEAHSSVTETNVQIPETAANTNVQTNESFQGAVSPQIEALRSMFPDFDVAVLQSVLDSVNNDQERALDILLGMSDPEYVSTHTTAQPEQASQMDLDEQLARQLLLEDQRQQRHASGVSWPRRSDEQVPYQARQQQHHPDAQGRLPPPEGGVGKSDFQELQRTMGQIAESGKRTFSSIMSRVKAKINEYEQSRTGPGQASGSSSATTPQWGSAPPTQLDRHSASQAYQQQYFGPGSAAQPQPSPNAEPHQTEISLQDNTQVTGYTVDAPPVRSQPQAQSVASPIPTPAARSVSPVASGLSPAASPRPSSDVPRPPPTGTGSPVNPAKIGLLPKKPVSLLNTNSPPATRPSDDDDELEYVENPFEERK